MFMELSSIYFKANLLKDLLISPGLDVKMYSNDILLHNKKVFRYTILNALIPLNKQFR